MGAALVATLCAAAAPAAHAASLMPMLCDHPPARGVADHARLLDLAEAARAELGRHGAGAALIARSGTDLRRWSIRLSHAAVALADGAAGAWSVRQLYFACAEQRPRIYDQGLAGFVAGLDDPRHAHLSIVRLPAHAAAMLDAAARDDTRALALLAGRYNAAAYPYDLREQNCNQWVAELLASAWGNLPAEPPGGARPAAQRWLVDAAFAPDPIELGSALWLLAAPFVPWLSLAEQHPEDLQAARVRTTLPSALEAFARRLWPSATRTTLCVAEDGAIVLRDGWDDPKPRQACHPEPGDRVVTNTASR